MRPAEFYLFMIEIGQFNSERMGVFTYEITCFNRKADRELLAKEVLIVVACRPILQAMLPGFAGETDH